MERSKKSNVYGKDVKYVYNYNLKYEDASTKAYS
jgi:hypothetical protein